MLVHSQGKKLEPSYLKSVITAWLKDFKTKLGFHARYINFNNSGENHTLERLSKMDGMGIPFDHAALCTPQQNGRVDSKFEAVYVGCKDEWW